MDIGARLKEAREQQNLSLDYLQETTKIQKRYLVAIEEGNFHILPGKFYAKAFIKEYANAVGLDAQDLLDQFEEREPEEEKEEKEEYTRIKQPSRESTSSRNTASILPKVTVVLLIAAIIVLAVVFYSKTASKSTDPVKNPDGNEIIRTPDDGEEDKDSTSKPKDTADKTDKATDKDKTEDKKPKKKKEKTDKKDVAFSVVETGTGSSPESTIDVEAKAEQAKIKVEAQGDGNSWLEVRKNGNSEYGGTFTKEAAPLELDLNSGEELYFIIGNAPAVKIEVNGKELEYPVDPEQKVFQKIKLNFKQSEQ